MLQTDVKRPLTIAGIVIGLSLVLGLGGLYLLGNSLASAAKAVSDARIASARASTLGPRIAALKDQEASAAAYTRVISLLLPTQEQLLEVPRAIEQLATGHNVAAHFQFQGSPQAGANAPGSALPFTLTADGNPTDLTAFLADLEVKNPRYTISLTNVELILNSIETGGGGKLNVNGTLYYQ